MNLTAAKLQEIAPTFTLAKATEHLPHLLSAMTEFSINTPARAAAFLAQIAHETGGFRWFEEIWGPTPAQLRYSPPSKLAATLGNVKAADGWRYRGRGAIQLTGRSNYRKYGLILGLGWKLEENPEMAAKPDLAYRIAACYWKTKGLNELADLSSFVTITKRINGGLNGYADRVRYWNRARKALKG